MKHQMFRIGATAAVVGMASLLALTPAQAQQNKILKMDVSGAGSVVHLMGTVFAKVFTRETGAQIQINDGQTLTRSAIKLGRGEIDLLPLPPSIYSFLSKGSRMYKKRLHTEAIAASKEIRSMLGFLANAVHGVTFESTGIKTWHEVKGKRVFTGPPSGGAAATTEQLIRTVTGYEPNKDYKAIRMGWGGGLQAMLDGKLDVYARPDAIGSALIEQLGLKRKFRLLGAGDVTKTEKWQKSYLSTPGRITATIPAGTYQGQIGGDVITGGGIFMFTMRKDMDEELVYKMTKALWANIDEVHQSARALKTIAKDNPLLGVNVPLHPGAIRYYKEAGITIPSHLM